MNSGIKNSDYSYGDFTQINVANELLLLSKHETLLNQGGDEVISPKGRIAKNSPPPPVAFYLPFP